MKPEIRLPLRKDWMRRPYFEPKQFPLDPTSVNQDDDPPVGWVSDGMRCSALSGFLREPTSGLFLVAGPRGIGKTTLVRHWLKQLPRDVKVHVADAGDLGLYESVDAERLERILLEGLFRALCEELIPVGIRGQLFDKAYFMWLRRRFLEGFQWVGRRKWSRRIHPRIEAKTESLEKRLPPDDQKDNVEFWRDLYSLAERTSADTHERRQTSNNSRTAALQGKLARYGIGFKAIRRWVFKRSTQSVWTNRTDAMRAEFRALLRRHQRRSWPLLVLDEWDRFGDSGDGGIPSVDQALQAIARLKSLLADYPAPVIVVGGEEIYQRVRAGTPSPRIRYNLPSDADIPLEVPARYANIFNQRCFLSPLPAWSLQGQTKPPLLYPYLMSLLDFSQLDDRVVEEKTRQTKRLSELLLLEVGPDPHGLKLWVGRNLSSDGAYLAPPWDSHAEFKVLMSRVVAMELERWELDYGAILTAGPYRRLIWLRYLRGRMFTYWSHVRPRGDQQLCLPRLKRRHTELAPLDFLGKLEAAMENWDTDFAIPSTDASTEASDDDQARQSTGGKTVDSARDLSELVQIQRLDLDARLLQTLYDITRRTYFEMGKEPRDFVQDDESANWGDWIRDGLFPWLPKRQDKADLMRGVTCYDLSGLDRSKVI